MKKPLFEPRWHAGSCLNWYILLSRIYSAGNTRYDPNPRFRSNLSAACHRITPRPILCRHAAQSIGSGASGATPISATCISGQYTKACHGRTTFEATGV